jgi:hypothetical protein
MKMREKFRFVADRAGIADRPLTRKYLESDPARFHDEKIIPFQN